MYPVGRAASVFVRVAGALADEDAFKVDIGAGYVVDGPEAKEALPVDYLLPIVDPVVDATLMEGGGSRPALATPELLGALMLDGCIITIEAMACQTQFAGTIRDREADYVSSLKGNQSILYAAVVETFAVESAEGVAGCNHNCHKTMNKNHGRIKTCRCWVIGTPEYCRYVDLDGV